MPDAPTDPIRKLVTNLLELASELVFAVNALDRDLQAQKATGVLEPAPPVVLDIPADLRLSASATVRTTAPRLPAAGPGEEG